MDYKRHLISTAIEFAAEFLGTFMILFFGLGCNAAIYHGYLSGTWQAGIIWGLGVACAVLSTKNVSGAHLNPSITIGFAAIFKFPLWKVPHYIVAQLLGAFSAAALNYSFFTSMISTYESARGIVRGSPGSFKSAAIFVCTLNKDVSIAQAIYIEFCITAILLLVVCILTNEKVDYGAYFPSVMIGLLVAILTGAFAPLTTACLNTARDFGPRLLTLAAGWGRSAIPGEQRNPFYPFIIGPILGGIAGAWIWKLLVDRLYTIAERERELAKKASEETLALVTGALASDTDSVKQ